MDFFQRREFLKTSMAATCSIFVSGGLSGCGGGDGTAGAAGASNADSNVTGPVYQNDNLAFIHGVKSGDPLQDSVIIWTRITPKGEDATTADNIPVKFQVAKDEKFEKVVNDGEVYAKKSSDYTVKIDVTNLDAYTKYYYRFSAAKGTIFSPTGKAQTLPPVYSTPTQAKMAVFSCSNYPNGYFNSYKEASKIDDLDFTIHLGDYIYEYGQWKDDDFDKKIPGYATRDSFKIGRALPDDNNKECITLTDYRKRYQLYSTDEGLQAIHAHCPMIVIWDDHEVCDNTYKDGANNHNPDKGEGDYNERVENVLKAYFEWLPIRPVGSNKRKIYRNFHFGQLLSLHMLETRLLARDENMGTLDILNTSAVKASTKTLMGDAQKAWLKEEVISSGALWQVLGQQVVMGKLWIPLPVTKILFEVGEPDLVTAVKDIVAGAYTGVYTDKAKNVLSGLLKILRELGELKKKIIADPENTNGTYANSEKSWLEAQTRPYNLDGWDGHYQEREELLHFFKDAGKNLVVLSGDSHNSWANNLVLDDYDKTPVGVEFAGTSVTSPGFDDYLGALSDAEIKELEGLATLLVDDLVHCNLKDRGFLEVAFTKDAATATYHYVKSNESTTYEMQDDIKKVFVHKLKAKTLTTS